MRYSCQKKPNPEPDPALLLSYKLKGIRGIKKLLNDTNSGASRQQHHQPFQLDISFTRLLKNA